MSSMKRVGGAAFVSGVCSALVVTGPVWLRKEN